MSKHYDEEFKLDSLKYRNDNPHLTVRAISRNLGISTQTFYNWQKASKKNNGDVLRRRSGNHESEETKEVARLKR